MFKNSINKGYFYASLLALVLMSCGGGSDYRNAIPAKSAAVVSIDLNSMAEKSGISGGNADKTLQNKVRNILTGSLSGSDALIGKVFDDVTESGLGLKDNIYAFAGEQSRMGGLLVKVVDEGKLEDLLDVFRTQQVCTAVRESEGCKWTVAGNWLVAYNSSSLILVSDNKGSEPESLVRQASMWLRQQDGEGFTSSSDFGLMQQKKGDIVMWGTLEALPHEIVYPVTMGISAELQLKDVKSVTSVNFENGKTVIDVETVVTDKIMKSLMDKKQTVTREIEGNYLDVFPANTAFWMSGNIKGGEFFNFLCENPSVKRYFEKSMIPLDFHSIFSAIDGDVVLAMNGDRNSSKRDFIAYADISNSGFMQSFETLKGMAARSGGQVFLGNYGDSGYEFKTYDGSLVGLKRGPVALWIGVKNGKLYVTNSEELINKRVLGLTLKDKAWGKRVKGQRFFMMSDLASLDNIFDLSKLQGSLASALVFFDGLDYLTVESADGENIHAEILMKDKNNNPLRMLLSK